MNKATEKLQKALLPAVEWVNKNRYLSALASAFTTLLPIIMTGAFALIVSKCPMTYTSFEEGTFWFSFFKSWTDLSKTYLGPLNFVNTLTMGSMSVYVTICIANIWADKYKLSHLHTIMVSLSAFLLVNTSLVTSKEAGSSITIGYFGGEGLFSAIIVAFVTVELFRFLVEKKFGKINFPPSVPTKLERSLSLLVPIFTILVGWAAIVSVLSIGFKTSLPKLILSISSPLSFAVDTPVGVSLVSSVGQLCWWFGIHNSAVLSVVKPIMYSNLAANAEAYGAGVAATQLPFVVNQAFFYHFGAIGGSGATLGLVLLLLRSKSEQLKAVGKFSILPALFNINEPVLFGLPLVMNPIMMIPLIFVQVVNLVVSYFVMSAGLVNRCIFFMGGTSPILMTQFFSTLDFKSLILFVVLVVVDTVLWYPFFKVYENEKVEEEEKTAKEKQLQNAG